MTTTKRVRDFIYLDTFRVRSLASQIGEGLTERKRVEEARSLETNSLLTSEGSSATSELRLTEERILLDHIYNDLEERITPSFITFEDTSATKIDLGGSPLLRVQGPVEVEDYTELSTFLKNHNEVGKIIAFPTLKEGKFSSDKQRENALTEHAKHTGLYQDPLALKHLHSFVEMFNPNALNFLFDCTRTTGYKARAVIDRACLRYDERMLRGLYAGASVVPWTLVGIITYVPSGEDALEATEESAQTLFKDGTPNMSLLYRNMFRSARFLSNAFGRSLGNEIVVLPLAVYRELSIRTSSSQ